jgi:hypothetical protein
MATNWPIWMRRRDASQYLLERHGIRHAEQTLAKLAVKGKGPRFQLRGRYPVYSQELLDEYAAGRSVGTVRSTGEAKHAREQLALQAAA